MFGQLVTVTWMSGGREAATSNERTLRLIVRVAYKGNHITGGQNSSAT